jgi:hypothetical protein
VPNLPMNRQKYWHWGSDSFFLSYFFFPYMDLKQIQNNIECNATCTICFYTQYIMQKTFALET